MSDEAIKKRILALMAKTVDNGCTEEEAIAAAKKVQQLLHDYQLTLSDIQINESKCVEAEYEVLQKSDQMVWWALSSIGYFTDTKVWKHTDWDGYISYKFFGLEHDVMVAEYITKICDWAIINGGEAYKDTDRYKMASKRQRPRLKADYQYGMACRLSERIRAMKREQQKRDIETTGRDLVIVKDQLVKSEFEKHGVSLRTTRKSSPRSVDSHAYGRGRADADKVALNPGVGGEDRTQIR